MRDETFVRICDMEDSHLINAFQFLLAKFSRTPDSISLMEPEFDNYGHKEFYKKFKDWTPALMAMFNHSHQTRGLLVEMASRDLLKKVSNKKQNYIVWAAWKRKANIDAGQKCIGIFSAWSPEEAKIFAYKVMPSGLFDSIPAHATYVVKPADSI